MPHDPSSDPAAWRPDLSHLDGLVAAAVAADRDGRIRYCNGAATALYGRARSELVGGDLLESVFRPEDRSAVQDLVGQTLAGGVWHGEMPVVAAGGVVRTAALSAAPVRDEGRTTGVLVTAEATGHGAERAQAHRLADRLTRLARVTAELMMADNLEMVTKIVIEHSAVAAGATVASLSLLVDDETLALIGIRGAHEGVAARWSTFPVAAVTPAGDAVRRGAPVVLSGEERIRAAYPDLEQVTEGERSLICLPLRVSGRPIGAVSMTFPGRRGFDTAELEFFGILADTAAQAIDRMNAVADAAVQTTKLEFLADASAELARSLDYQATLKRVARLAVPDYADWCSIQLVEDGVLRTLAVAHVDPAKVALADEIQRRYPADPDAPTGAYNVVRTGRSELIPDVSDEMLEAATVDEEHLRLARELNLRSAMSVPLVARGRILGVITWVIGEGGRRFGPRDLAFGEDLARRAAIAIDNSQLHSELRETAVRLQQAVLPEVLPQVPGWEVSAHYSPAGRTEVGGDFYDVVPLDDGRLAVFVGDVMGRGFSAAAAMATMRAAMRAYIAIDPDPEVVMGKLDQMFARYDFTQLVTVVYAVVDPGADLLRVVSAGHPPPVVVRADGYAEQLPGTEFAPLGVGAQARTALQVPFHAGDTLLAFTDGLIERRTEDIDAGQARLVEACPRLREPGLSSALHRLVESVRDHTRDDDVAAVALRRREPDA